LTSKSTVSWDAFDETVQKRLCLRSIQCRSSEYDKQGLCSRFAKQKPLDGIQRSLTALQWFESRPLSIVDRNIKEGQQG